MASDLKHPGGRSSGTGRFIMAVVIVGFVVFLVWFGWTHRGKNENTGGIMGSRPVPAHAPLPG
jgi:hypothetical protein